MNNPPNGMPTFGTGVPVIGQQAFAYRFGHAQLGLPVTPEQALGNFALFQQSGGQLGPEWVMMWVAASIEAMQLRQALVDLHARVLELEGRAGIAPRPGDVASEPQYDVDEQLDNDAAALPEWARKAAVAGAELDELCGPDGALEPATTEMRCRVCGCTNDDCSQCIARHGEPCTWVAPGLCSACADETALGAEGPTL